MQKNIFLILALLVFLVACVPQQDIGQEESVKEPAEDIEIPFEETSSAEKKPTKSDSEISSLVNKAKQTNNYQYTFDYDRRVGDKFINEISYRVMFRENILLIIYSSPKKIKNEVFVNKIYFDLSKNTVIAECDSTGILCNGLHKKLISVDYDNEFPKKIPHLEVSEIPSYSSKKGEEMISSRQTIIIGYDNIEMSLDKFSGLPMKILAKEEVEIVEKYSFNRLGLNTVSEADVAIPDLGYEVLES